MEMALEALETAEIDGNCEYGATEIIRKALAQPERTWVGLTDELREGAEPMFYCGAKWAERILKEKNFD
jgi:hypothetical protein